MAARQRQLPARCLDPGVTAARAGALCGVPPRDEAPRATLFNTLGCTTADDGIALLARRYPTAQLLPRHSYIAQDVAHRDATIADDEAWKARFRHKMADVEQQATTPRPSRPRTSRRRPAVRAGHQTDGDLVARSGSARPRLLTRPRSHTHNALRDP